MTVFFNSFFSDKLCITTVEEEGDLELQCSQSLFESQNQELQSSQSLFESQNQDDIVNTPEGISNGQNDDKDEEVLQNGCSVDQSNNDNVDQELNEKIDSQKSHSTVNIPVPTNEDQVQIIDVSEFLLNEIPQIITKTFKHPSLGSYIINFIIITFLFIIEFLKTFNLSLNSFLYHPVFFYNNQFFYWSSIVILFQTHKLF